MGRESGSAKVVSKVAIRSLASLDVARWIAVISILATAFAGLPGLTAASAVVAFCLDSIPSRQAVEDRARASELESTYVRQLFRQLVFVAAIVAVAPVESLSSVALTTLTAIVVVGARAGAELQLGLSGRRWASVYQSRGFETHIRVEAARSRLRTWRALVTIMGSIADLTLLAAIACMPINGSVASLLSLCAGVTAVSATVTSTFVWRNSPGLARAAELNRRLRLSVETLAPELVVYFSSPPSSSYALAVWFPLIKRCRPRTLIVLREAAHLAALDEPGPPIVVVPDAQDVEAIHVPSMRAALYPSNVVHNNHMIRLPGLLHAFIGHGDSDKAGSYSPVTRMYDEIWIAGPAAAERYRATGEGFRDEQFVEVGRPQLGELTRDMMDRFSRRPRALYAPTWEGYFAESDYSSLERMGVLIVSELAAQGYSVTFRPHPATGERRPEARRALRAVRRALRAERGEHRFASPRTRSIMSDLAEADVVVTDISSVASDFLVTGRPLVVTNPRDLPEDDFIERFPSAAAAYILPPRAGSLRDAFALIANGDPRATVRHAAARKVHGADLGIDPSERFLAEVDRFVARGRQYQADRERLAITEVAP